MMIHGGEKWDGYPLRNWLYYHELDSWLDGPQHVSASSKHWKDLYEKINQG